MDLIKLSITNNSMISAIYYALLQCGYEFYSIERDMSTIKYLQSYIMSDDREYGFFSEVRQDTCEVYPYWPRAAMLESATFFINSAQMRFINFDVYKRMIRSAENISNRERDQAFWDWIQRFPTAIYHVLQSNSFNRYLEWENDWIKKQKQNCEIDLRKIKDILALCQERFTLPFQNIEIVLTPIKCVYSADYHQSNGTFIFCSGALREESVIHEFVHRAVHPVVERRRDEILRCNFLYPGVDASYYLNGGETGKLNAFEEYMVRKLTDKILNGDVSESLDALFDWIVMNIGGTPQ